MVNRRMPKYISCAGMHKKSLAAAKALDDISTPSNACVTSDDVTLTEVSSSAVVSSSITSRDVTLSSNISVTSTTASDVSRVTAAVITSTTESSDIRIDDHVSNL